MPFRRRRPVLRAAAVGGAAYYAGKKVQEGREQDAETQARLEELEAGQEAGPEGITDEKIEQLKKLAELKDQGVLTEDEFEEQKRKILDS